MPLASYQSSYNGLTWGPGTNIQLDEVDGLRGMPTIRGGDEARPRQDGSFPGMNFLDERIITYQLEVFAPTVAVETVLTAIAAAFSNISDPAGQLALQFILPGWTEPRQTLCRVTALSMPVDHNFVFGDPSIDVQFTASDPLIYSSTLHSVSAGLPSPTAGLTFPVAFNVTFGSSTGGSLSCTNAGNYPTPPVFTITGPVTNPMVQLPSGLFFGCNITLGVGDVLVIDMGNRLVTFNGADRYTTVMNGSTWFALPVGTTSVNVESSDASPVSATFTCSWRDAWGSL